MTAFLLTWKESGWPHENIVRMASRFNTRGYVDEPWRIAAHKMAKIGDRVWVLKQGRGPKGIFGFGTITGLAALGEAGNGKTQWMAPIRFEGFVDPKLRLLVGEDSVERILRPAQLRAQASGYPLDDEQSDAFERVVIDGPPVDVEGTGDWTEMELRAIVADYFAMLDSELAGQAYSKTKHREMLRHTVQRSPGSIERKHENISAVLRELGLPWINGYKPLPNFQEALLRAVETQLVHKISQLDDANPVVEASSDQIGSIFVPPPKPAPPGRSRKGLGRLINRFDPAARDAANRKLGQSGEEFILRLEQERLIRAGRPDLSAKVAWVSQDIGDGLGYDIGSFFDDGAPKFVEVKTTRGGITTSFFISSNELRFAAEKRSAFHLYRVFSFGKQTRAYALSGPLEGALDLEPVNYRAKIGPSLV
jgi:hypothetical protein